MSKPLASPNDRKVSVLPGGRIPPDQSALVREAFVTGALRWAADLVHGDVIVASSPAPAPAPPPRGRAVRVTVGDVACVVADAMSRRQPTA